jgi:tetratricopeptide (TPR) repeat protein
MEHRGRAVWLVVGPLGAAGFWAQLVHVAVNFAYVYHRERYPDFQPPYGFLFVPRLAPLLAHSRALLSGDQRVDMWLVNVYRDFGFAHVLVITLPLLALLAFCLAKLASTFGTHVVSDAQSGPLSRRRVFAGLAMLCIGMGAALVIDHRHRPSPADGLVKKAIDQSQSEREAMRRGLELLYTRNDPVGAAVDFRKVLEYNPAHYGATFQLATALDRAGHPDEARRLWTRVLVMAEAYHDAKTASVAQQRLARPQ